MNWARIEPLLDASLDQPESRREAFVRKRAGADSALAEEVLALLRGAGPGADFLTPNEAAANDEPASLEPGARLGAWSVEALIGRGGMGEVYRVRRADGLYDQTAALKIAMPVSDDDASRFALERQTLAGLEHPGIARLLDGGVDAGHRAWMVLEYAEGAPIDQWCEDRAAPVGERLRLMQEVCEAVDYAHSRLIVHRDIKPANILVDESGRPRLIDFGLAAMVGGDSALHLSPGYAAPELYDGAAANTASDVYALAAATFRLLAGRAPQEMGPTSLSAAAWLAMGAPTLRLSDAPDRIAMPRALCADLDAILGRALSPRPGDRYRSAGSFAEDIRRALAHEPVSPRRASKSYTLRRFLRRNRWQSAAVAVIVAGLVVGLGVSRVQERQIRAERDAVLRQQARLEAVQHYLFFMLRDAASTDESQDVGEILDAAARQLVAQFEADPEQGGPVLHAVSELYFYLNDYEAAEPLLRRIVETDGLEADVEASANYDLAQIEQRKGEAEEAWEHLRAAQAIWMEDPRAWRRRLVESRLVEARLLRDSGEVESAIALLESAVPERIELSGPEHRDTGVLYNDLAVMLYASGQLEEAAPLFRQALEIWRANGLENSPDGLNTLNNLAAVEFQSGRPEAAEPLFARAVEVRRELYGPSAATAALLSNYGKTLLLLDRPSEAVEFLVEARAMALEYAGPGALHFAAASAGLLQAMVAAGRADGAAVLFAGDRQIVEEAAGPDHPASAVLAIGGAGALAETGREAEAAALLDRAETVMAALGPGGASQIAAINALRMQYGLPAPQTAPDTETPAP